MKKTNYILSIIYAIIAVAYIMLVASNGKSIFTLLPLFGQISLVITCLVLLIFFHIILAINRNSEPLFTTLSIIVLLITCCIIGIGNQCNGTECLSILFFEVILFIIVPASIVSGGMALYRLRKK
jgi:hypothetical protein